MGRGPAGGGGEIVKGAALGTAEMVEHLTTPTSIAMLALLPEVYAVPFLKVLIESGFTYQMASHVIDESPEVVEKLREGDIQGAVEKAVVVGSSAGLALLTGTRAIKTVRGKLVDPIIERSKWKEVPPERQGIAEPRQQLPGRQAKPKPIEPEVLPPTETDITRRVKAEEDITGMMMGEPTIVEVPGEGPVEFPASMSTVEVQDAIGNLERQPQTPSIPPGHSGRRR